MNREDVIRWAREAGIPSNELYHPNLERFAQAAYAAGAAAERKEMAEYCAEITRMAVEKAVAGAIEMEREWLIDLLNTKYRHTPPQIIEDIRARGQK